MSYTTYFLKFLNSDTFETIATDVGYKIITEAQLDEEGNEVIPEIISYSTETVSGPGAIDIIGTIYNDDAVYGDLDEEGMPTLVSPATPVEGYHVNICLRSDRELPSEFSEYVLDPVPSTPARTFG